MTTVERALAYLDAGFSVLPVRPGGDKRPAVDGWKELQEQPADADAVRRWFDPPGGRGVALVCGAVSGGLEVIDFDREAGPTYRAWADLVREWPGLLDRVSVVRTPRPGYHVWFRCGEMETPGNAVLASLSPAEQAAEKEAARKEDRKAELRLIETRGEGGYALAPGCPPACHETGRTYEHHAGCSLLELPSLSLDERDFLLSCARSLDRSGGVTEPIPKSSPTAGDLRPGDDFDRRGWDWGDILTGWECVGGSPGGERRWRRPGKRLGWSATTGHCTSGGADLLRVFTSNGEPFAEGKSYGKFRAFALLHFGGDLAQAAKALAGHGFGRGYGGGGGKSSLNQAPPLPPSAGATAGQPQQTQAFPDPIPASMLRLAEPGTSWIWNGLLKRGEITLMPALWKSGKTTLLAHLLRAMGGGGKFLGLDLLPCRVLYVTEESESRWASRRDAVGIEDHVEFLVRPFAYKPDVRRWEEFLTHVGSLAVPRRYDVVVFDTLANLWPLRDENDAAAVQACLMPMHRMIEDKAALTLVHHTRKSDGAEATASRGSGALTGFVDTIVEFRRYLPADRKDCRRVLSGYGRHDETPQELVIELTEGGYVSRGDREEVGLSDLTRAIRAVIPRTPPGLTASQMLDGWPEEVGPKPGERTLSNALHGGAKAGHWVQAGLGKKGSPFLYFMPPAGGPQ